MHLLTRLCLTVSLALALVSAPAAQAIEYATGSRVNTTVTQVSGTRGELVQLLEPVLTGVGWTVISGGGGTDVILKSVTTPQGYAMRVRFFDPGSGFCTRVRMGNDSGSAMATGDMFLLPAAGRIWRIVANGHQFFIYEDGTGGTSSRRVVMGGVPFVPTWNQASISNSVVWGANDAGTDNAGTPGNSTFRNCLALDECVNSGNTANLFQLINAGWIEGTNSNTNNPGTARLVVALSSFWATGNNAYRAGLRFLDDSYFVSDPWIAFDATSFGSEGKVIGMLWDGMVIMNGGLTADSTFTFDGHTFIVITAPNSGNGLTSGGQLCVRVS